MKVTRNLNIKVPKNLPVPCGPRLVVIVPKIEAKTASGLYIPETRVAEEELATTIVYVAAISQDAYLDQDEYPNGAWVEEGDWVLIGKYNGTRFFVTDEDGVEWQCRTISEKSVLNVVPEPNAIKRSNDGIAFG